MRRTIEMHPVLVFVLLTVGLSWLVFVLPLPPDSRVLLTQMMAAALPLPIAFILTGIVEGKTGVSRLLRNLLDWRLPLKAILLIIVVAAALRITVSVLALLTGTITRISFGTPSMAVIVIVFIFALTEEVGWRGFALSRLLPHHSPLSAALILGIPWGIIHVGLTLPGLAHEGSSPLLYIVMVVAMSVITTWAYLRAGARISGAVLIHAAQSALVFMNANVPLGDQFWLLALSSTVIATLLVLLTGFSLRRDPAPANALEPATQSEVR